MAREEVEGEGTRRVLLLAVVVDEGWWWFGLLLLLLVLLLVLLLRVELETEDVFGSIEAASKRCCGAIDEVLMW